MTHTILTRRQAIMTAGAGLFALGAGTQALAQSQAQLIYTDGLKNDWTIGGWSEQQADVDFDTQKVIRVNMKAWNGLTFQSPTPIETSGLNALTLLLHGGETGGQELKVSLSLGRKSITQALTLNGVANQWARYDSTFKQFRPKGKYFDTILIQNMTPGDIPEFYLNFVLLQ